MDATRRVIPLDLSLFRHLECVVHLDPEVPDGAFEFCMAKQELDGKVVPGLQEGLVDPLLNSPSGIGRKFELNRSPRLLLDNGGPLECSSAVDDISDLETHEVTASELAVDRKIEQSKVSRVLVELESDADPPDLREFQRWLWPDQVALVLRGAFGCLLAGRVRGGHGCISPQGWGVKHRP